MLTKPNRAGDRGERLYAEACAEGCEADMLGVLDTSARPLGESIRDTLKASLPFETWVRVVKVLASLAHTAHYYREGILRRSPALGAPGGAEADRFVRRSFLRIERATRNLLAALDAHTKTPMPGAERHVTAAHLAALAGYRIKLERLANLRRDLPELRSDVELLAARARPRAGRPPDTELDGLFADVRSTLRMVEASERRARRARAPRRRPWRPTTELVETVARAVAKAAGRQISETSDLSRHVRSRR